MTASFFDVRERVRKLALALELGWTDVFLLVAYVGLVWAFYQAYLFMTEVEQVLQNKTIYPAVMLVLCSSLILVGAFHLLREWLRAWLRYTQRQQQTERQH